MGRVRRGWDGANFCRRDTDMGSSSVLSSVVSCTAAEE